MHYLNHISIIGSGPSAIYLLKNIHNHIDELKNHIRSITIFEKEKICGMGMPYHPSTTDIYNLANISSEEIPLLQEPFVEWLSVQSDEFLTDYNIDKNDINEKEVYSRIVLGHYFHDQFEQLIELLKSEGIKIYLFCESEVLDIKKKDEEHFQVIPSNQQDTFYTSVVIATGHGFKEVDKPKEGYYATPWPIQKILPKSGNLYNFPIGILGASLSAFDVVTSLSHRHGKFISSGDKKKFIKSPHAPDFKIVLHDAQGWLPHLQYEQQEPIREIYRHFNRQEILNLVNPEGYLSLNSYFDKLCRKPLIKAFAKDNMMDTVHELEHPEFQFKDFIKHMSDRHEYTNSFDGMKLEMVKARQSIEDDLPIHWMETLDDLMYSLNYHAELLSLEDHQFFHKEIMAFVMNVIAALPLQSAEILLALYDAKVIELKEGFVTIEETPSKSNKTLLTLKTDDGKKSQYEYELFINCGGQKKMELEEFPFPSLVKQGIIRKAVAKFPPKDESKNAVVGKDSAQEKDSDFELSGIDIDSAYRTINASGKPNINLFDINFTHTSGLRPYSYGLQACSATSKIMVESWLNEASGSLNKPKDIKETSKLYEKTEEL